MFISVMVVRYRLPDLDGALEDCQKALELDRGILFLFISLFLSFPFFLLVFLLSLLLSSY